MALLVPAAFANPGTVKVSGDQSQNDPNNQPHVPCQFSLEFFQFQAETVHVDFAAQQPSGDVHILSDTVTLNPSGDEEPTFNGTKGYDFTGLLDGLERHDQQGYHIKVTVDEDPANPPAKHKVFWVDCPEPEPEPAPANLLVDKVVTGDGAPDPTTAFTIDVTCDGTTVTATLTGGDAPWSWNADSGEDPLTEDSVCSVDETVSHEADISVTFNGVTSAEEANAELGEGDNTFVVTNFFPGEGPLAANLLVDKDVTGGGAPADTTVFTVEVTCDGITVTAPVSEAGDPWSWNALSGEDPLTEESECSVLETGDRGNTVTVTFNGATSGEQNPEGLAAGDNTFLIANNFPPGGGVGGAVAADLLVDKVVTGDGAPDAETVFTIVVTCDDIPVTAILTDGDAPWSWNDDSGESDLTDESVCSVDETVSHDAGSITVTFNGATSGEQTTEELGEGDNTFVVTNFFPAQGGVGGVDVELPVEQPAVDVSPDVVEAAPAGEQPVAGEQPAAAQDVADEQVAAAELPATGASNTVLLLLALTLIGFGGLAVRKADARVRAN